MSRKYFIYYNMIGGDKCTKSTHAKYEKRPSPPYPANDCQEQKKKGNDGNMWISSKTNNNVYRWKKIASKQERIEVNDWFNKYSNKWITIKDIEKLKKGDKVKIVVLDRNFLDIVSNPNINKENTSYSPQVFFKNNWGIYTHNDGLQGTLFEAWMKKDKKPPKENFEFDVEYKKGKWYPLKNGILPAKDLQFNFNLLGKKMHWTEFPKNTKVGYRGPMIFWKDLKDMPQIYWKGE